MDPAPNHEHQYFITLTTSDNFSDEHQSTIVGWHKNASSKCLLVCELHDSGKRHYHSTICTPAPKSAGKVTEKLSRLYDVMGLDHVPRVSIVVKKVTDAVGILHYLSKDIPEGGKPLLCWGWQYSWIKQQCVDGIKKIPLRMLRKDQYMVQNSSSVQLIIQYAKAAGYPLTGKRSFITVTTEMQSKGYQFEKTKPRWLYAQVMAMCGYQSLSARLWEACLHDLD